MKRTASSLAKKLLAVTAIALCLVLTACAGEKIVWDDIVLGDMLPQPPKDKGDIHNNATDSLWLDVNDITDKQYADYVEACKNKGYTVDAESNSSSYRAFNDKGYELSLSHYGSDGAEMSIQLEAPMEMSEITWPTSTAGKLIPAPKSTTGKFSYEHDDNFFVYVGNTTKAEYEKYVSTCSAAGFDLDFSKSDKYYSAKNADGWKLDIRYEGSNVISICINAPKAEASAPATTVPAPTDTTAPDTDADGIGADFKAAMDSYESFMDEYVSIVKKYKANPSDTSILASYTEYMSKYSEFVSSFNKWKNTDLNAAEAAYYLEVQTRVSKKLVEAAY